VKYFLVLAVSVNVSGNATVGELFTLTCSVTQVENITGLATIQWMGPDGNPVVDKGPIIVGTAEKKERVVTSSLKFNPLFTSHGGEYTCQGSLVSQSDTYTILARQDVIVRGIQILLSIWSHIYILFSSMQYLLLLSTSLESLLFLFTLGQLCY